MNNTNANSEDYELGQRLRAVREQSGVSQRALAKKTGVPNSTISLIESGKMNPSVGALRRILDGIPISLSEFFAFEPELEKTSFYAAEDLTEIGKGKLSLKTLALDPIPAGTHADWLDPVVWLDSSVIGG